MVAVKTCDFWEEERKWGIKPVISGKKEGKKMENFTNMWKPGFDQENKKEKQTNERNSLIFAHM